jgi:hypothetical protein
MRVQRAWRGDANRGHVPVGGPDRLHSLRETVKYPWFQPLRSDAVMFARGGLIGLKRSHADVRSTNIYGNSDAHIPIITEAACPRITRRAC